MSWSVSIASRCPGGWAVFEPVRCRERVLFLARRKKKCCHLVLASKICSSALLGRSLANLFYFLSLPSIVRGFCCAWTSRSVRGSMGARRGRACGVMGWALCAELFIPTGVGLQGEKVGEVGSMYQAWRTVLPVLAFSNSFASSKNNHEMLWWFALGLVIRRPIAVKSSGLTRARRRPRRQHLPGRAGPP